ncbi:hypothetical protein FSP39_021191, partial [Pinctada imbricata]
GGSSLADSSRKDVAFSAGLSHTLRLSQGETIPFNKIFVNVGDGYNPRTGEFIAPTAGVYVFHLHAYDMNKDKAMWLEAVRNTQLMVSISGYDSHATAGNTVMAQMNRGDKFFIRARAGQQFSLFGQDDEVYATFTGYKVSNVHFSDQGSSANQNPFGFFPGGR